MTIIRLWSSSSASVGIRRPWRHPWNSFNRKMQRAHTYDSTSVSMNLTLLDYSTLRISCQGESEWLLLEKSESNGEDRDLLKLSNRDMATAPLLTREAYILTKHGGQATQYGVLGRALAIQCIYFFIHATHPH